MLKTLGRLFRLKPYENQLMDGTAEVWLMLAAVNIASIALCDAVAWGYFGYTTAQGKAAYVAAAMAGLIVLTLVGSLDASFIMHDRTRRETRDVPHGRGSWWRWVRRNVHRDHVALSARIVLVILTFTVTAPFLTQLFFARDITAAIERRNEQVMAAKRQGIIGGFDRRILDLRERLSSRQRDLEKEIAGSGASGRYGRGPTAAALQREIDGMQAELGALQEAKSTEVQSFDAAVRTPGILASRYGVDLLREGPDIRARVVAQLEKSAPFRATERTIKAFLVFMFLGLICLKLFQPESVRIYYSGHLQAAWARLGAGIFNHRLDPREHPGTAAMTPIRFADWYENDQQVRDLTERLQAQEDAVRVLHETVRLDIARMQEELAAVTKTGDDLEQRVLASQQQLNVLNAKIAEEQQALDDFRYDLAADLSLRDQQLLISTRNKTVQHLAEHRAAAAGLTASLHGLQQRLEASRSYENQLRAAVNGAGTEISSLTEVLQNVRQRRVSEVLGASRPPTEPTTVPQTSPEPLTAE